MSKLSRVEQVIFGETGGTTEFAEFGSNSAGSPVKTKDLATIQALSQFQSGLYAATGSGANPPFIQDINSLFLLLTSQIRYGHQVGIPEWLTTQDYYVGSVVQVDGVIYVSQTGTDGSENSGNDPTTDYTNWHLWQNTANGGTPGELVFDIIVPGSGTYGSQTMAWGASAGGPPSSYQNRRVIAASNGVVLISDYADMCQAIYCGDANNATADYCYKTSDSAGATRSTSGTYMVLPDFRGVTVRGYDTGKIHDPLGSTRGVNNTLGLLASLQKDAFQGHIHSNSAPTGSGGVWGTSGTYYATTVASGVPVTDGTVTHQDGTVGTSQVPRTSNETRMYNASCNIGLRY